MLNKNAEEVIILYIFWNSLQDFKEKEFLWTHCKQMRIYLYLCIYYHKASQSVMIQNNLKCITRNKS